MKGIKIYRIRARTYERLVNSNLSVWFESQSEIVAS